MNSILPQHTVLPKMDAEVIRKVFDTPDICVFEFKSPKGRRALPRFTAGAHIEVCLRNGITRSYSLCNSPTELGRYVIAVLREPNSRGGSVAMHDEIEEGAIVQIRAPANHFPLEAGARRSILIAGGIGVTPLLSMAEVLSNAGADFELHYCARSEERMAFKSHIAQSRFAERVFFHFDDQPETRIDIAGVLKNPDTDMHLYFCGPGGFMDFVKGAAEKANWSLPNVHFEYFGAAVQMNASDPPFDVELARSGKRITIPPGRTVVSVLAENGVDVPVSCEQGICGTCMVPLLSGDPDHRDHILTPAERGGSRLFIPCVSRGKGGCLVLDI